MGRGAPLHAIKRDGNFMSETEESPYIPALNKSWLTPLYDPLLKWGMKEEKFKRYLVENTGLKPGQQVLDLGCGTGTLTILLKQFQPAAEITGLDGDPHILEIARQKSKTAGVNILWQLGLAYDLPYPTASFDRVISCLMIHHLTAANKVKAFKEVRRVLKPGGEFHILDFGRSQDLLMRLISIFMARMEEAGDNLRGLIPPMLQEAGFKSVNTRARFKTIFGELAHLQVLKSE